jgi:hypothetical protein
MDMSWAGCITVIGFTVLMLIDLWFVLFRGKGGTVSNFLVRAGFTPTISVGAGLLIGHLFTTMTACPDPKWYTPGYNVNFTISLVAALGIVTGLCYLKKKNTGA